jgi:hypothetical protein
VGFWSVRRPWLWVIVILNMAASDALVEAAEMFDRALRRRDSARRRAEEAMLGAEKRQRKALGGMPLSVAAPCRHWWSSPQPRQGRQVHVVPARRVAVEVALGSLALLQTSRQAEIAAADAAERLLDHGPPVSSCLAGRSPRCASSSAVSTLRCNEDVARRYPTSVPWEDPDG